MTISYTSLSVDVPTVTGTDLLTSGSTQIVVTACPHCNGCHRHLGVGLRRSACGRPYIIVPATTGPQLIAA